MPTYAYVCKDCAHAFDVQQSFSDDALTTCPECGGNLRKQFGAVGVVFKGSGFYKTDSRDSGKKSTASAPASAKKDTSPTTASGDTSSSTSSSSNTTTSTTTSSSDGSAA
ncbi:MAG TPA: FmdB family zinc ribbon protein [Flexivirga sp.]|uniref:FmdB family zinc ribbon protein n=1 Tax=Flexivirga sp. TaxID=1962927 RepID=UPI002D0B02ED|nr:FmdB family zinc ribbon protein [Flexivirga sp.]HWC23015.1 FmdB family zinc ribbon protein [Flexivirga sp.]